MTLMLYTFKCTFFMHQSQTCSVSFKMLGLTTKQDKDIRPSLCEVVQCGWSTFRVKLNRVAEPYFNPGSSLVLIQTDFVLKIICQVFVTLFYPVGSPVAPVKWYYQEVPRMLQTTSTWLMGGGTMFIWHHYRSATIPTRN